MSIKPGWYPDPSGRYPKRWYDGNDWTASVLDNEALQSYDQLPPAASPAVASPPAAAPAVLPPPPPARTAAPPPARTAAPPPARTAAPPPPATPMPPPPRAPATPSPRDPAEPWPPGQSWQSTPSQTAQPDTPTTSGGVWPQQRPVTTASLGLTPPPVVRVSAGSPTTPVVYGLIGLAVACLVLSMFVLDWYSAAGQSVGFRDFGDGSILSSAPFLDKLTFWNFQWLGFVLAGLALASVFFFVIAGAWSHHIGHVLASIAATAGALVSTLAIVRLFRTDAFNPDVGAWLLPAGYLVLLVAIVISARDEPV